MQSQRLAPPAPATLCCGRVPVRGILVVVGGFLMHMTLGTQLTYGEACWSVLLPVCLSVCLTVVRQCVLVSLLLSVRLTTCLQVTEVFCL